MVIVAVVLVLLGPDKLPEVAHRVGSTWRAMKRLQEKVEAEVREAIPDLPSTHDIVRIARSPVNMLNQLADRAEAREAASAPAEAGAGTSAPSPGSVGETTAPPTRLAQVSQPPDPSLN